jgi:microcystin degradation protein MlrC
MPASNAGLFPRPTAIKNHAKSILLLMTHHMCIAIGQMWQETNTFNCCATTLADFQNWGIATGSDVLEKFGETGELGGFIFGTRQWNCPPELIGLARFLCWPSGRVHREAWDAIQNAFSTSLDRAGKIDGVLISLHGAMASEGDDDLSGALSELIRRAIGPETPLVASLDLHANVTRRMMAHADLLVGYHTQIKSGMKATDAYNKYGVL